MALKGLLGEARPAGGYASPTTLNHEQFTGGPKEAMHLAAGIPGRQSQQGELFSPASVPMAEAHQQTPTQFARDPRTWWHGRYTERVPKSGNTGEGFHVGTLGAAQNRLETNYGRRRATRKTGGGETPQEGRLFPLRITTPVEPEYSRSTRLSDLQETATLLRGHHPAEPRGDTARHRQLNPEGHYTPGGGTTRRNAYYYENESEDPGHVSLGVQKREQHLSTQKEMVAGAKARGEYIHPLIAWAVKNHPEHTGIDAVAHKRYAGWESDPDMAMPRPELFNRAQFSSGSSYDRRTYTQASGHQVNVMRHFDYAPGAANLPKVWTGRH